MIDIRASNPWKDHGEFLESPTPSEDETPSGDKILQSLSDILAKWPRETTAIASDKERHLRFILAIAGYPEIDVATTPLDWPLNPVSINALEVSITLDQVQGIHEGTSLRSSILNRDLNYRISGDEELEKAHEDCLSALFARLRQLDGMNLEDSSFRKSELTLLSTLHSNDNGRRNNWWPKLDTFSKYEKIVNRDCKKPNMKDMQDMPLMIKEYGVDYPKVVQLKKQDADWKVWRGFNNFTLPNDMEEMTFQFHYVQTWLDKLMPKQDFSGTVQRFIRGYSLLLELLTSEVLQRVAKKIGIGSVLIDGGGRVSFLCPSKMKEDMEDELEEAKGQFLSLGFSQARNNIRIKTTMDNWAESCVNAKQIVEERDAKKQHEPQQADYDLWFEDLKGFLPPISLGRIDEDSENAVNNAEIARKLNDLPFPMVIDAKQKECVLCSGEELDEDTINRIDSWMGLNDKNKAENITCTSHRLLYFIGHDQRLKDSSLRKRGEDEEDDGGQRTVTGISMLDGNSLGVIFSERYPSSEKSINLDRKRRRSFRFNYHWWSSISTSIEKHGNGDRIAAWVTAGDDVVLAQYQPTNHENVEDHLEKMIRDLAKKIERPLDKEIFLSFGAGLAKKKSGERILKQLDRSRILEKSAKDIWKKKAKEEWSEMLTLPTRNQQEEPIQKPIRDGIQNIESAWINGTKSVLLTDDHEFESGNESLKTPKKFDLLNGELDADTVGKIEIYGSKLEGYDGLWNYIKRGYFVSKSDGVHIRLEVLPPKVI